VIDPTDRAITPASAVSDPTITYPDRTPSAPPRTPMQRFRFALVIVVALALVGGAVTLVRALTLTTTAPATDPLVYGDGNLTLLVFVQGDCCQDSLQTAELIADEYRGDLYVTLADVARASNESLIMRYRIGQLGAMVLLDDQGAAIAAYPGSVSAATLRDGVRTRLVALRQRAD